MRKEQAHTSKGGGAPMPKSDFNKDAWQQLCCNHASE